MKKNYKQWLKKLNLQEIEIPNMGIFAFGVNVIIGPYSGVEEYVAYQFETEKRDNPSVYQPLGRVFTYKDRLPILWIPRYPKTPTEYATLAHESLHIVYDVMEWAGIPMTRDTEEVATHTMAYIVKTILQSKE